MWDGRKGATKRQMSGCAQWKAEHCRSAVCSGRHAQGSGIRANLWARRVCLNALCSIDMCAPAKYPRREGRVELRRHGARIDKIGHSDEHCRTCHGAGAQVGRRLGLEGSRPCVGVPRACSWPWHCCLGTAVGDSPHSAKPLASLVAACSRPSQQCNLTLQAASHNKPAHRRATELAQPNGWACSSRT